MKMSAACFEFNLIIALLIGFATLCVAADNWAGNLLPASFPAPLPNLYAVDTIDIYEPGREPYDPARHWHPGK